MKTGDLAFVMIMTFLSGVCVALGLDDLSTDHIGRGVVTLAWSVWPLVAAAWSGREAAKQFRETVSRNSFSEGKRP